MRTVRVRIRRLSPGLDFRMDLGSNSGDGCCWSAISASDFEGSEISAIGEL